MNTNLDEENQSVLTVLLARIRVDSNLTTERVDVNSLTNKDCIILLMGPPGSGKNTFMEVVAGTRISGRRGSEHPETRASAIRLSVPNRNPASAVHDPDIVLVNNPAFNDVGKSDKEILRIISGWLQKTYQKGIHVSGVIFFHRITDAKLEGTPMRNWRALENICGDHFKNVVVATTMWGDVDGEAGSTKEQELRDFLGNHPTRGWITHRFYHANRASAADILAPILDRRAKRPLLLQSEISDHHLSLKQTSAARALYSELEAFLGDCKKKHKDIDDAIKDRSTTKERLKELEAQLNKSYDLIARVKAGLLDLKETGGECFHRHVLQTPGLGSVLRSVGLPSRPGDDVVEFDGPGGENEP